MGALQCATMYIGSWAWWASAHHSGLFGPVVELLSSGSGSNTVLDWHWWIMCLYKLIMSSSQKPSLCIIIWLYSPRYFLESLDNVKILVDNTHLCMSWYPNIDPDNIVWVCINSGIHLYTIWLELHIAIHSPYLIWSLYNVVTEQAMMTSHDEISRTIGW